jgi:hypothetical protein
VIREFPKNYIDSCYLKMLLFKAVRVKMCVDNGGIFNHLHMLSQLEKYNNKTPSLFNSTQIVGG